MDERTRERERETEMAFVFLLLVSTLGSCCLSDGAIVAMAIGEAWCCHRYGSRFCSISALSENV